MSETLPHEQAELQEQGAFFRLVQDMIESRLKDMSIDIEGLKPFLASSQVNFLFEGLLGQKEVIVKASYFHRSILFAFERFLLVGPDAFREELHQFDKAGSDSGLLEEAKALSRFIEAGIPAPRVITQLPPSLIVLEKVNGKTLDENEGADSEIGRLMEGISKIHRLAPGTEQAAEIRLSGNDVEIIDPNFHTPAVFHNVSNRLGAMLSEVQKEAQHVLHGDLKGNNVILSESGPVFIDPKLHRGHPYYDLGKFLVRSSISAASKGNQQAAYSFLSEALKRYAELEGRNPAALEERSIVFGLMEVGRILAASPRPHAEILGKELKTIAAIRERLLVTIDRAINTDKTVLLKDLFTA